MYKHDLKKLIKIVSTMDKKEWDKFKSFIDNKFKYCGYVENNDLTYDTLTTFFIEIQKENEKENTLPDVPLERKHYSF